ncbi:MAG: hypothetical protein A2284_03770 [Deltaproteobacteria bacterium RIFOXYA12_FULL_61_11]|nr:MAG: hypothetical protein A2284_03770 [Deltaproteobacteria bacterium RIFOXYA12_FULL_61_11]
MVRQVWLLGIALLLTACGEEGGPMERYKVIEGLARVPKGMGGALPDYEVKALHLNYKLPDADEIVVDFEPREFTSGLEIVPKDKEVSLYTLSESGETSQRIAWTRTDEQGHFFFIVPALYYRHVLAVGLGNDEDLRLLVHVTDPERVQLEPFNEFVFVLVNHFLLGRAKGLSTLSWESTGTLVRLCERLAKLAQDLDIDVSKLGATTLKDVVVELVRRHLFDLDTAGDVAAFLSKETGLDRAEVQTALLGDQVRERLVLGIAGATAFDVFQREELVTVGGKGAVVGSVKQATASSGLAEEYRPLEGATVRLLDASGSEVARRSTGKFGLFAFADLVPARYQLSIEVTGVSQPFEVPIFTVGADQITDIKEIVVPRRAR